MKKKTLFFFSYCSFSKKTYQTFLTIKNNFLWPTLRIPTTAPWPLGYKEKGNPSIFLQSTVFGNCLQYRNKKVYCKPWYLHWDFSSKNTECMMLRASNWLEITDNLKFWVACSFHFHFPVTHLISQFNFQSLLLNNSGSNALTHGKYTVYDNSKNILVCSWILHNIKPVVWMLQF